MSDLITQLAQTPAEQAAQLLKLQKLKKEVDARVKELNALLLYEMQQQGVLTLKTEKYTISRAKRTTVSVVDHQELAEDLVRKTTIEPKWVTVLDEITINAAKLAMKAGMSLDGVESKETEYVMVRLPKEQKEQKEEK